MHSRQPISESLRRLAVEQALVVTREQVLGCGVSRAALSRMVDEGHWRRLARGLYATSPGMPDWQGLAWGGVLLGGDAARLAGRAAAHLHGLTSEPREIQVLVPVVGRAKVLTPWVFTRERPGVRSGRSRGSPPRTTIEDTILDLIDDPDCSERQAVTWMGNALAKRLTTLARLRRAADSRSRLRHRRLVFRLLPDLEAGVRSPLELDYLRLVERPHGLPIGRRQDSRRGTDQDVEYVGYGLLVELDGLLGHEAEGRFRDMRRDNAATSAGLATLRYGHVDVHGVPCETADQVGSNLMLRGWSGPPTRCRRCRRVR